MTYMDALAEMLAADHKVRRKGWEHPKAYIKITDGRIYKHTGYGHYTEWIKPMSDIRALDWEIYVP